MPMHNSMQKPLRFVSFSQLWNVLFEYLLVQLIKHPIAFLLNQFDQFLSYLNYLLCDSELFYKVFLRLTLIDNINVLNTLFSNLLAIQSEAFSTTWKSPFLKLPS